jgi:hypothetical protein
VGVEKKFISIWFFIGALLAIYGALILASGIYGLYAPPATAVAMPQLHIAIWWGVGMLLFGLVYAIRFWPNRNRPR